MIYLILSLDYEFFGNGSGDVRRDMIEPTDRLLALCDRYGAKATIFFEVAEYWAMKKAERAGSLHLGYSPSKEIKGQVQNAVQRGHDVQLHLHPWWIGATFEADSWQLHPDWVRISDLPNGMGSEDDPFSIVGALCRGKRTLEHMLHPVRAEYMCVAYRAGGFCGQPSKELIAGMKKAGLAADSSVVSGLYETAPVATDYRRARSATGYWWTSADDISQSGPKGKHILEFPICSKLQAYLYNFKWTKFHASLKRGSLEKANTHGHGMMQARSSSRPIRQILKELGTMYPFKYDFCKLGAGDMIRRLKQLIKDDQAERNSFATPVVMLGHSKDFWNDRNLEVFLRFVKEECEGRVRFSTLGEFARRILERDTRCQEDSAHGVAAQSRTTCGDSNAK